MKTIGIFRPRRANSRCRLGPDMPGMVTSKTRHFVWATQSEARNSSAEANVRTLKPNRLTRSGTDTLTDSSSSTIATRAASFIPRFSPGAPYRHSPGWHRGSEYHGRSHAQPRKRRRWRPILYWARPRVVLDGFQ